MGQANVSKSKREPTILVTGSYSAGKKTLVKKLTSGTDQSEAGSTSINKTDFQFLPWDFGGRGMARPLYRYLCSKLEAVLIVVDSVDKDLLQNGYLLDQYHELQGILSEDDAKDPLPVLIVANKQDLPGALTCQEVLQGLRLDLDSGRHHTVVDILPLSLETGEGLTEVREWLERQQKRKQLRKAIVQPVQKAVPPAVTSAYGKMSSALKQAFGRVKKKLSVHS